MPAQIPERKDQPWRRHPDTGRAAAGGQVLLDERELKTTYTNAYRIHTALKKR
jgi:hypothetical protein